MKFSTVDVVFDNVSLVPSIKLKAVTPSKGEPGSCNGWRRAVTMGTASARDGLRHRDMNASGILVVLRIRQPVLKESLAC